MLRFLLNFAHVFIRLSALLFFLSSGLHAATIHIHNGDSFEAAVEDLLPGDTLVVHEGVYSDSARIDITVKGTSSAPVIIKGAEGESRPLITRSLSASLQNTINIVGATSVSIQGLEITGNGGDGIKMYGSPSYITLEDLVIHDVDVGINFRSDMHDIVVRRNHIHHTGAAGTTGEGMYIGCNDAACIVHNSVIEGNWIHDTLSASQGDGIEIKKGSHTILVRDNVIHDTKYPCILVYGTGGNPPNKIEGNAVWNCGDSGIQAAADAIIQNNIILYSPANGFNSQDHQGVSPKNLTFIHNTLIGGNPCLRMSDWSNKQGLVFANNAIYCEADNFKITGLDGVTVSGNVIYPATAEFPASGYLAGDSISADFVSASNFDVYPSPNSVLIDAGDSSHAVLFDFNGLARTSTPEAGAYEWEGSDNPGWNLIPGFKGTVSTDAIHPASPANLRLE
jgi:hypothetical protein